MPELFLQRSGDTAGIPARRCSPSSNRSRGT